MYCVLGGKKTRPLHQCFVPAFGQEIEPTANTYYYIYLHFNLCKGGKFSIHRGKTLPFLTHAAVWLSINCRYLISKSKKRLGNACVIFHCQLISIVKSKLYIIDVLFLNFVDKWCSYLNASLSMWPIRLFINLADSIVEATPKTSASNDSSPASTTSTWVMYGTGKSAINPTEEK